MSKIRENKNLSQEGLKVMIRTSDLRGLDNLSQESSASQQQEFNLVKSPRAFVTFGT